MSARLEQLRAALPAIVAAHAVKTLFALGLLGGFGTALAAASESGAPSAGPGWLIALGLGALGQGSAGAQWLVVVYVFVTPLLTQLVLAALARRCALRIALKAARERYARALLQALCGYCALGLLLLAGYAGAERLPALAPRGAVYEESVRALSVALALFGALYASTVFDLAAARLAHERCALLPAIGAGLRATRSKALLVHAALIAASGALFALGELGVRDVAWPALALAAQQTLALGSSSLRALWLGHALDLASSNETAHMNRPEQADSYGLVQKD